MSAGIRPLQTASQPAADWSPVGKVPNAVRYIVVHGVGADTADPNAPVAHIAIKSDGTLTQNIALDQAGSLPTPGNWKGVDVLAEHCISVVLTVTADTASTQAQHRTLDHMLRTLAASAPQLRDVITLAQASIGVHAPDNLRLDLDRLRATLPKHSDDFGPVYRVNIAHGDRLFVRTGPAQPWGATGTLLSGDLVHLQTRAYRRKAGQMCETGWALVTAHHSRTPLGFVDTDHLIAVPNVDAMLGSPARP